MKIISFQTQNHEYLMYTWSEKAWIKVTGACHSSNGEVTWNYSF